jgi:putative flippase GtrA
VAVLYSVGALLAIVVNIGTQEAVTWMLPTSFWPVVVSVVCGTGTGLVFKYVWDKALIFRYRAGSVGRDLKTFGGYSLTGIGTTAIFWAFEFGFDLVFGTKVMRYAGAVIGLVIGYVIKYQLDRRFVFVAGPGVTS